MKREELAEHIDQELDAKRPNLDLIMDLVDEYTTSVGLKDYENGYRDGRADEWYEQHKL